MVYPKPPAILTERDLRPADLDTDLTGALLRTYAWMQVARTADNRILDLFRQGLIRGTVTGGQGNARNSVLFDNVLINTVNGGAVKPTVFAQDSHSLYKK